MPSESLANLPVHVFDFQAFECTNCGRCCNKRWKVTIDPHQIAGIRESKAYKERARDGYTPLAIGDDGLARLGAQDGDYCVFFDEEKWCTLHGELGLYGKPRGCQLFPYHANDTPDGTYVTLSFACPPVVAGKDRDIETNRQDLTHVLEYRRSLASEPVPGETIVHLTPGQVISWESYRNLEARLLEAYEPAQPIDSLLKIILSMLRVDPDQTDWPALATVNEDLSFPKEILTKFLATMVASLEDEDELADRIALITKLETGGSITSQRLDVEMPPLRLELAEGSLLFEVFDRFFRNMVLGKGLIKTTIIERLLTTLCAMVIVDYYSRGYQTVRQESTPSLESITLAFDIVEMNIVTHNQSLNHVFHRMTDTFQKLADLPVDVI